MDIDPENDQLEVRTYELNDLDEKQIIEQKKRAISDVCKDYPEEDRLMIDLVLRQGKDKPEAFEKINAIRQQEGAKIMTSGAYDTRWCRLISRLQNDMADSDPLYFEPVSTPENKTHPGNQ